MFYRGKTDPIEDKLDITKWLKIFGITMSFLLAVLFFLI